jgi:hypothetical protein
MAFFRLARSVRNKKRGFKIGAPEQTRHAPAQSSPAQINANAFVLRIAHRVVPETMREAGTGLRS